MSATRLHRGDPADCPICREAVLAARRRRRREHLTGYLVAAAIVATLAGAEALVHGATW